MVPAERVIKFETGELQQKFEVGDPVRAVVEGTDIYGISGRVLAIENTDMHGNPAKHEHYPKYVVYTPRGRFSFYHWEIE